MGAKTVPYLPDYPWHPSPPSSLGPMPPQSYQSRRLSQEELEAAASQDGTTVMRSVYDNEYQAWRVCDVDAVMETIVQQTLAARANGVDDVDTIRALAVKCPGVAAFAALHPVTVKLLCTPSFVANEDSMTMTRTMMRERYRVETGQVSQEEANQRVANETLAQLYQAAKRAEAAEDE